MKQTIVGIHQPNYLPWFGYFYKIAHCDIFVILDNVQYSKGSYTNRVMIKGTAQQEFLLTVPLKNQLGAFKSINEIEIDTSKKWIESHLKSISLSYKKAPFYNSYFPPIEKCLFQNNKYLSALNINLIKLIVDLLNIKTKVIMASELLLKSTEKNDRIIEICKTLECEQYLSGKGGLMYHDIEKFNASGIKVVDLNFTHPTYLQFDTNFTPNLSIIDALFFWGTPIININETKSSLK